MHSFCKYKMTYSVQLVLPVCAQVEHGQSASSHISIQNDFYFSISLQLPIAPHLGVRSRESSSLIHARNLTGLILCRSCTSSQSCCGFTSLMTLSYPKGQHFVALTSIFCFLYFFFLLFHKVLWTLEWLVQISHVGWSLPVAYFQDIDQLWISALTAA